MTGSLDVAKADAAMRRVVVYAYQGHRALIHLSPDENMRTLMIGLLAEMASELLAALKTATPEDQLKAEIFALSRAVDAELTRKVGSA